MNNTDFLLNRGVAEVIVRSELSQLLNSGKKLRLKEGFDPSFPDIHLGHMVALRKLRQFQEQGHQVVLIVGDWTAQIGDPTGRSATRPMLSAEQVKTNAATYMEQFFKIVEKSKTEVRWQSDWFGKFSLADVIRLTSRFTVAQLLARDDFNKRFAENQPIAVTELMYPLLQAYDSTVIQSDVEFGGIDQKFNILAGRQLQEMVGQRPQQCLMTPLLVGTDGIRKMSKSLGNYVGVAEPAEEKFGKIMSITDKLILQYFELLTDVPDKELAEFKQAMENNAVNPMTLKKRLAREIITQLDSAAAANIAEKQFEKVHQKGETPEEVPQHHLSLSRLKSEREGKIFVDYSSILLETGLVQSRSEANRLIAQAGTSVAGHVVTNRWIPAEMVQSGTVIKVGKLRYAKIIDSDQGNSPPASATQPSR